MEGSTDWKAQVFGRLSPSQRIELAMELWDSVVPDRSPLPVSDAALAELRSRIEAIDAGSMQCHPWHEVKQRLLRDVP